MVLVAHSGHESTSLPFFSSVLARKHLHQQAIKIGWLRQEPPSSQFYAKWDVDNVFGCFFGVRYVILPPFHSGWWFVISGSVHDSPTTIRQIRGDL